jgi:peptidoglycan/xylan/chitin deacetylase (PgdA/CDA1 family)
MPEQLPGALVISLDFELHWGVRVHQRPDGPYRANLLGARAAIPRLLDLFDRYDIGATWATVGFLFGSSRGELTRFSPEVRPGYPASRQDPYLEELGDDEESDPLHYAGSLIRRISVSPRQEIASHTFSHYYCLESGSTRASFAADLRAAVAIARAHGITLRSLVFPRNQVRADFLDLLPANGIESFRGNPTGWLYLPRVRTGERRLPVRAARLADDYVSLTGDNIISWGEILTRADLCNVRASRFLRPYSPGLRALERLRWRRITHSLETAAQQKRIFHLWWHPHNFGLHPGENLEMLISILECFRKCRERYGMLSLSMSEVSRAVRPAEQQHVHVS